MLTGGLTASEALQKLREEALDQDTITAYVALVFFLPLLSDSGGNAGSQLQRKPGYPPAAQMDYVNDLPGPERPEYPLRQVRRGGHSRPTRWRTAASYFKDGERGYGTPCTPCRYSIASLSFILRQCHAGGAKSQAVLSI